MSAVIPSTPAAPALRWRTALPVFLLLLLAVALLYRDTAAVMIGIWERSETFAHAWLVLPLTLWMVWRQRVRLSQLTPRPQPWVLLPMAAIALLWMLADLVVVNAATQYGMVALLILTVPLVLGLDVTRTILFPLLYLFFAVPFGEFMVPTLMEWTADFVVAALRATGIPVLREGQNFVIPSGSWSVIDECSGVRYLMASFTVGSLFAYLNYRTSWKRAAFMAFALAVPIVANWLRAYIIVMLAHLSGNRIATGVDHILYGWVFFGLIIFLMFIVGAHWAEPDEPAPASAGAAGGKPAAAPTGRASRAMLATAAAGLAVALLPHGIVAALERAEGAAAPVQLQLPAQLTPGWAAAPAGAHGLPAWTPEFANPSLQASQVYAGPAGTVGVHVAYVRGQTDQRKLVTSQHLLVGMRDPLFPFPVSGAQRSVAVDGQPVAFRSAELTAREPLYAGHRPQLQVWRSYWIDGRWVAGDVRAKLVGAAARLQGRGDEGALLVLYADAGSPPASNAALEAFVRDNLASLNTLLQRTRDQR